MTDEYVAYLEERVSQLTVDNEKLAEQRNWVIQEMEKSGCALISLPGMEPIVENIKIADIRKRLSKLLPDSKVNEVINDRSI